MSYNDMLANFAEKIHMVGQIRIAGEEAKGHKTLNGAQEFYDHITLLQSYSRAEPTMTPQQVV